MIFSCPRENKSLTVDKLNACMASDGLLILTDDKHASLPLPLPLPLPLMPPTLHATRRTPHGASRLVQAMSAWSVITRRAPSRHCRDSRVSGHTTAAMHDHDY
ncbi:unnamed protein product, partial [Laminaria digitata]